MVRGFRWGGKEVRDGSGYEYEYEYEYEHGVRVGVSPGTGVGVLTVGEWRIGSWD